MAPDPELRLSAKAALALPVFDDYRGSQLPALSHKLMQNQDDYFPTDIFDDDISALRSIKSLEARSIRVCNNDRNSNNNSVNSVRIDGEGPLGIESKGFDPNNLYKKAILTRMASSNFQTPNLDTGKELTGYHDSLDTGSNKASHDEFISPMASPLPSKRPLDCSISNPNGREFGAGGQFPTVMKQVSLFASRGNCHIHYGENQFK